MYFIDLPGGLGNQIFAYFAGLYLNERTKETCKLQFATKSTSHVGSRYDISSLKLQLPPIGLNLPNSLFSPFYFPERNSFTRMTSNLIPIKPIIRFNLGNDTKEIFDKVISTLETSVIPRRITGFFGDFAFFDALPRNKQSLQLLNQSLNYEKNLTTIQSCYSIGIHIRAGDYLELKQSVGLLGDDYYQVALAEVLSNNDKPTFFVFTNDVDYARRRTIRWGLKGCHFVTPTSLADPAESLILMSYCRKLITSNSTFSLWAAKISGVETQVWTPKSWRKDSLLDIVNKPKEWRQIDSAWEV
jgi:hypothetical protein